MALGPASGRRFQWRRDLSLPYCRATSARWHNPNIDISYSSRGVDGLVSTNLNSGPLGTGWQFSAVEITRNGDFMQDDGANLRWQVVHDLSLSINGQVYKLVTTDDLLANTVRYYARNAPQLFIERIYDPSATGTNPDKIYWLVKTPDGTTYRLGYTADSESGQQYWFTDMAGGENAGASSTYTGIRWRVDTVTDVSGNQVQYDYAALPDQSDTYTVSGRNGGALTTGKRRIQDIRYNFASQASSFSDRRLSSEAKTEIVFSGTVDGKRVQQIQLFNNGDFVHPYHLIKLGIDSVTHTGGGDATTDRVTWIQETSGDGLQVLPATNMSYTAYAHSSCCGRDYEYVTQIDNGYGGRTHLSYASDQRAVGTETGASWYLTQTTTWPSVILAPAQSSDTNYQYQIPCYDQADGDVGSMAGAFDCPAHDNYGGIFGNSPYAHGSLIGFMTTTVTSLDYDGVTTLAKTRSQFYQTPVDWIGKPFQQQALYPLTSAILQQTDTLYASTGMTATSFVYTSVVTQTVFASGNSQLHVTKYYYDTSEQGNGQYGNLTRQEDYDSSGSLYRCTKRRYYPNTAQWLVSQPAFENVYSPCTWNVADAASSTSYIYQPGSADDTQSPSSSGRGLVWTVRRWEKNSNLYADTLYNYDTYGNRITEIAFKTSMGTLAALASGVRYTTTTGYDSTYHMLPITVTNALTQTTIIGYDLNWGKPLTVTDPNGAVSTYQYDAFGRLTKVFKPGDGSDPSLQYSYGDTGGTLYLNPLLITTWHKPASLALAERHFYDGLGREIQVHNAYNVIPSGYATPQDTMVSTGYDALGRVTYQTVPYAVPAYGSVGNPYTTTSLATTPRTLTAYDNLSRPITTTAPDGSLTLHSYGVALEGATWTTFADVVDANRHRSQTRTDPFGRAIAVYEMAGNCGAASYAIYGCGGTYTTTWTVAATTHYTYTALDQLTQLSDAYGHLTSISYNTLGQKTGMTDPDMGHWVYQYDPAGNLITQTDALTQVLLFTYDPLNRLTQKKLNSGAVLATYGYDAGTYGRGQRTSMVNTASKTTWTYNARGLATSQVISVAGAGLYTMTFAYDGLDRLNSITYPGSGEVVTQTYNNQQQLENVNSTTYGWYASNLNYDEANRLTLLSLGNNTLQTAFGYYAWTSSAGLGRLHTLQSGPPGTPTSLQNLTYAYDAVGNVALAGGRVGRPDADLWL